MNIFAERNCVVDGVKMTEWVVMFDDDEPIFVKLPWSIYTGAASAVGKRLEAVARACRRLDKPVVSHLVRTCHYLVDSGRFGVIDTIDDVTRTFPTLLEWLETNIPGHEFGKFAPCLVNHYRRRAFSNPRQVL